MQVSNTFIVFKHLQHCLWIVLYVVHQSVIKMSNHSFVSRNKLIRAKLRSVCIWYWSIVQRTFADNTGVATNQPVQFLVLLWEDISLKSNIVHTISILCTTHTYVHVLYSMCVLLHIHINTYVPLAGIDKWHTLFPISSFPLLTCSTAPWCLHWLYPLDYTNNI